MLFGVVVVVGFLLSHEIAISNPQRELQFSMLEKIRNGIALLKATPPLGEHQIALAVLDAKTGELSEHRIEVSQDGEIIAQDPALPFAIRWWNAFNSVYEIDGRPELVVVANKYRIERQYLPEQKTLRLDLDAPTSRYVDMVYAPYSEFLDRPEVIAAGKAYIDEHAGAAFEALRVQHVESIAMPGQLVADVVPIDLVKTIVLVEHVDPSWLGLADDGGKALVERTLVIIGANQEWAYRYTNSKAGANGLAQFIKSTYDSMVTLYPDAHLIQDHNLGMADHTNAFKAIALYFDAHMKDFPDRAMLAAVYNGGPGRISQAVAHDGARWATSAYLAPETIDYVKKYEMISNLHVF